MIGKTVIPFGPQHAVFPEPFHWRLVMEEERVLDAIPGIGYMHRGIEQLATRMEFAKTLFLAERVCGICSFMHALAYAESLEKLMDVEVPPRAKYLRTIWAELARLQSHLLWIGLAADAFGFESLFMQAWRVREYVMDMVEFTEGGRVMTSSVTIGGVRRDLHEEAIEFLLENLDKLEVGFEEVYQVFTEDPLIKHRTVGVGILSKEDSIRLGAVGPTLRGSGVAQDMRMLGYAAYGELEFQPVVEDSCDSYARMVVRLKECFQSINLIRQAIKKLPDGDVLVKVRGKPEGEVVTRIEQPRGELLYYIKANGTKSLERFRIRTPTLSNLPPLMHMIKGACMADVPVITLSIDTCIACTER